jgi:indole-3-glycerol phosphate synthase
VNIMFLEEVVAVKRRELMRRRKQTPLGELEQIINSRPVPLSFEHALKATGLSLIAEIKKASPSKGVIRSHISPVRLADSYVKGGAAAISVLTETRYFRGRLYYLETVKRRQPHIPLLRKDFIMEPYQIYESRARGADALLLIVAILEDMRLQALLSLSRSLGMQCLVEVHDEEEVQRALSCGARVIGVNNRNLKTLAVDINVTRRLRPLIPADHIVVSESGIKDGRDINKLRDWGIDAVLIGEALVASDSPVSKIGELFDQN